MASWRQTTGKQYNTYLSRSSRWLLYCREKHLNMNQATVNDGLEFLTYLYRQGLGYSAINTARSALSAVITLGDKTTFGEHPLVTRFLKGIFEIKPSLPRYSVVWDVGTVLKYLQTYLATYFRPAIKATYNKIGYATRFHIYAGVARQSHVFHSWPN